jgi:molybdenum cofactor cytidylyltransferase
MSAAPTGNSHARSVIRAPLRTGKPETGCVVLSAGASSRMGRHKALLPMPDGRSFLSQIIFQYRRAGVQCIAVVLHPGIPLESIPIDPEVTVVVNHAASAGRLGSLRLGLAALPGVDHCFVHNIDNPFVDPATIEHLHAVRDRAASITPCHQERGGHPILLGPAAIDLIAERTETDLPLRDVLALLPRHRVEVQDARILANVNTPQDHAHWFGTATADEHA